jgi:DNA helicase-2/ATP-dependent DNA helicase PcrA
VKSNIRFQTNVLCIQQGKECLELSDIISRLGYFELMAYRNVNPVLWNPLPNYRWTERQQYELDSPRGRREVDPDSLWHRRIDFRAMPATNVSNPFEWNERQDAPVPENIGHPTDPEAPSESIETAPDMPQPEVLINEQDEVITADIDEDMLVVAPPGTGKTHVLIERIVHLVSSGHVDNPLAEILVLSFTRSAVSELKKRLLAKVNAGGDQRLLYVQIRTFDSLATHYLRNDIDRGEIVSGFSDRIEQFNALLTGEKLRNSEDEISKLRFLLVDEVQDLNGARARMVLALAGRISRNAGCCMFLGDPAQAIYDFEENDSSDKFTSVDFLKSLSSGSYTDRTLVKKEFSTYRRFETDEMLKFVRKARFAMGEDGLSPDGSMLDELLRTLGARVAFASLESDVDHIDSTAVLVRNNLEAHSVWSWCRSKGIDATLWRGSSGNYWPGWIGRLFIGFEGDRISMETVRLRWMKHIAPLVSITYEQAVEYLLAQGLIDEGDDGIQLSEIAGRMQNNAPVAAGNSVNNGLVISTIHRSKGLEFDHVLVLPPNKVASDEELRVIYVAATRAKKSLRLLSRDGDIIKKGRKNSSALSTNAFHIYRYPAYPNIGLLLDGCDVMDHGSVLNFPDPQENQKLLWSECSGRQRNVRISEGLISISDAGIGRLSSACLDDIRKVSQLRGIAPGVRDDLQIIDLATVVLDDFETNAADVLGRAGMAIVPVITGITSI